MRRERPDLQHAPRHWVLILGDQLWHGNPALEGFDPNQDRVLMIEAASEAQYVWSHKARIALFLSAMRHFCNELHQHGIPYTYCALSDQSLSFREQIIAEIRRPVADFLHKTQKIIVCEPGEVRMRALLEDAARELQLPIEFRADSHFMCSIARFAQYAKGKKELRMEFFYREMRREYGVLMNGKEPEGGQWNFDADNRSAYPKAGPGSIPPPANFAPDRITQEVFELVEARFGDHPGSLAHFAWPVTRQQALDALQRFIDTRLVHYGAYQDAMWTDTPFGWHALLSTSLNLHLLDPREVVAAAEQAYRDGRAQLASVEGFIRQILGWREFIRGVYWHEMPGLKTDNHFGHRRALPKWYWTGETQMACMRECIGQTLQYGYAHHIQRLMVTGQFALLAQIEPQQVADWYLAVYVDAIEWVELPNVAGMTLFANGGRFTSKPYIASGQYIARMSNYCKTCRYMPEQRHGESACPVTTLFWHFLDTHEASLTKNPRTVMMAKNLQRLSQDERNQIRAHARRLLQDLDAL